MVSVVFYNFSKKRNSTKRPSGSGLGSFNCVLKEPSGVISPTIFLGGVSDTLPRDANYAYIATFARYYFVTDWTWTDGGWSARLAVDVMATYKTQIGSSTQYVRRAQSAYNTSIIDDVIPTRPAPVGQSSGFKDANSSYSMGDPFPVSTITGGRYVVGIINSDNNAVGSTSYYVFDDYQFRKFKVLLMGIGNYSSDTTQQDILRAQFNPISYIGSVKWFPCEIARENTPLSSIPFGWWTLSGDFTAFRITGAPTVSKGVLTPSAVSTTDGYTVRIPFHPQSMVKIPGTGDPRHSNVDNDKYSKYSLVARPFGIFPLPADVVANAYSINITISIDPMSGMGSLRCFADTNGVMEYSELASASTRIGVDIPMAQIAVDNLAIASSAIDVAAGATSGVLGAATGGLLGDIGGFATAAKAGINMVASSVPQVRASGAMGSIAEYYMPTKPLLRALFYRLAEESPATMGYPLAQNRQISGLSGFIMCGNVELDLPATETEQDQVVAMMTGGFEYE